MISDEMLCIAAGEYEQALLSSLPEIGECHHAFSPKFEKKMRHLCHKVKYASAYSVTKRVACAIIAIVLCGSMLLMLNTEVRAAVIGWIREAYNSFTAYFFVGDTNEDPVSQSYDFETVPEGYIFADRMDTDSGTTILYMSEAGRFLDLSYEFNIDKNTFFFKPEDHIHTQENVDGKTMDIYLSKKPEYNSTIIWNVDGKIIFQINANCDKDGLIALSRNVRPVK